MHVCTVFLMCIGTDRPIHRLLNKYVIKEVAPCWRELGGHLLVEESVCMLNIIEKNYPRDVQRCCSEMFELWLREDPEASWNTLIDALEQIGQNTLAENIKKDGLKGIF